MNEATREYIAELEGRLKEAQEAADEAIAEAERLRDTLDKITAAFAMLDEALGGHAMMEGDRIGRLTLLTQVWLPLGRQGWRTEHWQCRCICGNETTVWVGNLRHHNTRSCGCARRDINAMMHLRHGESRRRSLNHKSATEYNSWMGMIGRCENPRNHKFKHYGGRGISICERWRQSYEAFLCDMGRRPPGLSLDRIDNDGNYEPDNCRWATPKEQVANQRKRRPNHVA